MLIIRIIDLFRQGFARLCGMLGVDAPIYQRALRRPPTLTGPDQKVLIHFVCQGNILRSAYAAERCTQLLREKGLTKYSVSSSGTTTQDGKPADPRGRKISKIHGISLEHHKSRLVSEDELQRAWLVLTMDSQIQSSLSHRFPDQKTKFLLLGSLLLPQGEGPFIQDPFTKDEQFIEWCFGLIDRAVTKLVEKLPDVESPSASSPSLS